jgi:hypothetical protein
MNDNTYGTIFVNLLHNRVIYPIPAVNQKRFVNGIKNIRKWKLYYEIAMAHIQCSRNMGAQTIQEVIILTGDRK